MKIDRLSMQAQGGIRCFCDCVFGDPLVIEDFGSSPEKWAWLWMQLREAEDKPEWFPKGKWATLQIIEQILVEEARASLKAA
jgi:hypothetical protein